MPADVTKSGCDIAAVACCGSMGMPIGTAPLGGWPPAVLPLTPSAYRLAGNAVTWSTCSSDSEKYRAF
eukprot:4737733-Prymnesium_polylepis.2